MIKNIAVAIRLIIIAIAILLIIDDNRTRNITINDQQRIKSDKW